MGELQSKPKDYNFPVQFRQNFKEHLRATGFLWLKTYLELPNNSNDHTKKLLNAEFREPNQWYVIDVQQLTKSLYEALRRDPDCKFYIFNDSNQFCRFADFSWQNVKEHFKDSLAFTKTIDIPALLQRRSEVQEYKLQIQNILDANAETCAGITVKCSPAQKLFVTEQNLTDRISFAKLLFAARIPNNETTRGLFPAALRLDETDEHFYIWLSSVQACSFLPYKTSIMAFHNDSRNL